MGLPGGPIGIAAILKTVGDFEGLLRTLLTRDTLITFAHPNAAQHAAVGLNPFSISVQQTGAPTRTLTLAVNFMGMQLSFTFVDPFPANDVIVNFS